MAGLTGLLGVVLMYFVGARLYSVAPRASIRPWYRQQSPVCGARPHSHAGYGASFFLTVAFAGMVLGLDPRADAATNRLWIHIAAIGCALAVLSKGLYWHRAARALWCFTCSSSVISLCSESSTWRLPASYLLLMRTVVYRSLNPEPRVSRGFSLCTNISNAIRARFISAINPGIFSFRSSRPANIQMPDMQIGSASIIQGRFPRTMATFPSSRPASRRAFK